MRISALFTHRVRGVRLVNLWGAGVLLVLVIGLYLVKTFAGDEGADIARTEGQIADEHRRIRLLQAELAYLEQPERIEALSTRYLGLQPLSGKHVVPVSELQKIALTPAPAQASPAPTAAAKAGMAR